jgi:hypothetical protein
MKDDYVKQQSKWLENTGLQVGDKCIVAFSPSSFEEGENWHGWTCGWAEEMNDCVGKVGVIQAIGTAYYHAETPLKNGIGLVVPGDGHPQDAKAWFYPFFCLIPAGDE